MLGDNSASYEVRQGKLKRDHLDNTHNAHGYMCQPISTAGLHGWEFVLKNDVKFIWDGISDSSGEHVEILEGGVTVDGHRFVDTGTANATISFQINCIIETDPDHYVWLTGAPNYFIDGVQAGIPRIVSQPSNKFSSFVRIISFNRVKHHPI
jgi:hypothetical protein